MRKTLLVLTCLLMTLPGPLSAGVEAAPAMTRLGEDPAGDGWPSLDVTYLDVGRSGKNLELHIGMSGLLPVTGGIPDLPGIEWVFEVGGKVWVAEAVPGSPARFFLFEYDGTTFKESTTAPTGEFLFDEGYIQILVPLKAIGAKRGSVVAGSLELGDGDVDAHVHPPALGTIYPDSMVTTKAYKIP